MTAYRIEAAPAVDADIEAAFSWYESEEPDLGFEFLEEVRSHISESSKDHSGIRN